MWRGKKNMTQEIGQEKNALKLACLFVLTLGTAGQPT